MFVLLKIYGEVILRIKINKLNKLRDRKTEIEDSIKSDKKEIIKCKNLLRLFENYSIEPIHNGMTSYDCKVCMRVLEQAIVKKNTEIENICNLLASSP
jgi:prephenate dehydratase